MFKSLFQYTIIVGLVSGCVRYVPRPIDPTASELAYRTRTLTDPGLKAFINANSMANSQAWPPKTMDLEALAIVALYYNPDLDEARLRVVAAESADATARVRPNPNVTGAAGYTDSERSPYAFQFGLGILIETAGKKKYRTLQAQQLTDAARFSLGETVWTLRSRLRAALVDHLVATRELEQLIVESAIREEAVAIHERRIAAGESSTPFVTAARSDLAHIQLAVEQMRGKIAETRANIAGIAGLPSAALDNVQFAVADLDSPPAEQALNIQSVQKLGLLNRLDVQRLLSEYSAADSNLRLQIARQYPDVVLGPGYSFGEGSNTFLIGPSLALPVFDLNRGPIAEAEARRDITRSRFLSAQTSAIAEMEKALAEYRSALREWNQAQTSLDLTLQREQAGTRMLNAGEIDRLALVTLRLETVTVTRDRIGALRRVHTALGALEDAVQHPLPSDVSMPETTTANPQEKRGEPQ